MNLRAALVGQGAIKVAHAFSHVLVINLCVVTRPGSNGLSNELALSGIIPEDTKGIRVLLIQERIRTPVAFSISSRPPGMVMVASQNEYACWC